MQDLQMTDQISGMKSRTWNCNTWKMQDQRRFNSNMEGCSITPLRRFWVQFTLIKVTCLALPNGQADACQLNSVNCFDLRQLACVWSLLRMKLSIVTTRRFILRSYIFIWCTLFRFLHFQVLQFRVLQFHVVQIHVLPCRCSLVCHFQVVHFRDPVNYSLRISSGFSVKELFLLNPDRIPRELATITLPREIVPIA